MKCVTISHSAFRIGLLRPSDFMKNIPDEHVSRVGSDSLSAFRANVPVQYAQFALVE